MLSDWALITGSALFGLAVYMGCVIYTRKSGVAFERKLRAVRFKQKYMLIKKLTGRKK